MRFGSTLLALAACLLAAPTAHALEEILLDDGEVIEGDILSVEPSGLVIRFRTSGGGTAQLLMKAHELDPHFFYEQRRRAAADDAKAHLALGRWATDNGLWMRARASLRKAVRLNEEMATQIDEDRFQAIRDRIAEQILEKAREDMKAGRSPRAEERLEALLARMADTPSGAYAADLIDEAQKLSAAAAAKAKVEQKARMAAEARAAEEAREELLAPVRGQLAKGKELMAQGLKEDSTSAALDLLAKALDRGRNALELVKDLEAEHADDEALLGETGRLRQRIIRSLVTLHIHRADIYADRPSIPNAREELEKAKQLDPESSRVHRASKRLDEREEEERWEIRTRRDRAANGGRFRGRRGGRLPLGGGR